MGMTLVSVRYSPDLTFIEKFGAQLLIWYAWAAWSLIILAVCDRVPFERGRFRRALAVTIPLSVVIVLAQILVVYTITQLYGLGPEHGLESIIYLGVRSEGDIYFFIFWAIVGAHAALRWHDAWRAETIVNARLGADLAQAQLNALKAQLNPHFLFNALNSVVTLIRRDAAAAEQMTVRLADLLRSTLALSEEQEISLRDEIALVGHYLEIEQMRFHDRLTVTWDIDRDVRNATLPSLALQPLVENAIVHGVSRLTGAGTIHIQADAVGSTLVVSIRDNGPGLSAMSSRGGAGIGIANLRARLSRLYGDGASLSVSTPAGGGCEARLVVPLREAT